MAAHAQGYEGLHFKLLPGTVLPPDHWQVPPHSVPIRGDVLAFDWAALVETAGPFDAIVMDPPWFLTDIKPTRGVLPAPCSLAYGSLAAGRAAPWPLQEPDRVRAAGVALAYNQLTDADLIKLPIPDLQPRGGLVFVWVINAKLHVCLEMFEAWGYTCAP